MVIRFPTARDDFRFRFSVDQWNTLTAGQAPTIVDLLYLIDALEAYVLYLSGGVGTTIAPHVEKAALTNVTTAGYTYPFNEAFADANYLVVYECSKDGRLVGCDKVQRTESITFTPIEDDVTIRFKAEAL